MKNFKCICILFAFIACFSCDEEGSDDPFFGEGFGDQTLIGFNDAQADFSIQLDETQDFEVLVNTTTPSSTDRVIPIMISENSTLDPTFFSLSANSVTIPANEFFGSLTVTITDPVGEIAEPEFLILTIPESPDFLLGGSSSTTITVGVECPFVYSDIPEGLYEVTLSDFGEFFEETSMTRTVELGPGENQVTILEGEFPIEGSDPLIITLDDVGRVIAVNEDGLAFGNGPISAANNFPPNFYLLGSDEGRVLSCIGQFDLVLNYTPFSGNVHSFNLRFIQ